MSRIRYSILTIIILLGCNPNFQKVFYEVSPVKNTSQAPYLSPGDAVLLHYPIVSISILEKFAIGEFDVTDLTDKVYQEFILQLRARDITVYNYEQSGYADISMSVEILDYDEQGIDQFDFQDDGDLAAHWDTRETTGGRIGFLPPCYFMSGVVSITTEEGVRRIRLEKSNSYISYKRGLDLRENVLIFATAAIDELTQSR